MRNLLFWYFRPPRPSLTLSSHGRCKRCPAHPTLIVDLMKMDPRHSFISSKCRWSQSSAQQIKKVLYTSAHFALIRGGWVLFGHPNWHPPTLLRSGIAFTLAFLLALIISRLLPLSRWLWLIHISSNISSIMNMFSEEDSATYAYY